MSLAGASGRWVRNTTADVIWITGAIALGVTAVCSFAYGWTQGTPEQFIGPVTYQHVNSSLFLLYDVAAAVFAAGAAQLYLARSWLPFLFVSVLCAFFGCLALSNTIAFTGMEKAKVMAGQTHDASGYSALVADVKRIEKELGWVPVGRPAELVTADLSLKERDEKFRRTKGCDPEKITLPESRTFCDEYAGLDAERKSAGTRARLNLDLLAAQEKVRATKPVSNGDTLATAMHDFFGWNEDKTSRQAPTLRALGAWLLAVFGFACSDMVRANGRVQASSGHVPAPSVPVPAIEVVNPPVESSLHLPAPVETEEPSAPAEPEEPLETAIGQAPNSDGRSLVAIEGAPDPAEQGVAQWAWQMPAGAYPLERLKPRYAAFVEDREVPSINKKQLGKALEKLGYKRFRDPKNGKKVSFRFDRNARIVGDATLKRA